MALGPPEPKVFNRLRIQVNGVSAIPLLPQPIGILEQNYAKTISRHATASPFALSTPRQRSPYRRAVKMRIVRLKTFFQKPGQKPGETMLFEQPKTL
jgi:hypothetical protein